MMFSKILLVDDHFIIRSGATLILEEGIENIKVSTAKDYQEAISFLETHIFDLLILDIDIPGGKKTDMFQELRQIQPDLKILIFTGYDDEIFAYRYILAGANGYLNKQLEELLIF